MAGSARVRARGGMSTIVRVALVVITMFATMVVYATSASAASVSGVSVSLSSRAVSATHVDYTVDFTTSRAAPSSTRRGRSRSRPRRAPRSALSAACPSRRRMTARTGA